MALISAKRFLTQLEEEAAYRRVISMLLDGVAASALNIDPDARQSFSDRIVEIRKDIAAATSVEDLISGARDGVHAIGEYSKETSRLLQSRSAEMQEMIASLTHAPAGAGGNGGHAGSPVLKIAAGLETAAGEKASALKEHLPESLDGVEEDANRQEAESDQMVQLPARNLGIDPVTGLPWEGAAQAHFLAAIRNGEQKHVVVFVLGSAQRINLRFGRAAGDQVIRALKEHLAGQLDSGDRMFRWPGPAIVALLATSDPFDRVRTRLKRVLDKHIEREFDINGRSVLIPLTTAWSVFALSIPLAVPSRQIHDFIAGQGYREEDPIPA